MQVYGADKESNNGSSNVKQSAFNKFLTYLVESRERERETAYGSRIKIRLAPRHTGDETKELKGSSSANVNDVSILSHIINIWLVVREQFAYDRA